MARRDWFILAANYIIGTVTTTLNWIYNCTEEKYVVVPAGIEPATLSVWRTRDNHYTKEPAEQGGNCFVETFLQYKNIGCVCHHRYNRGLVAQRITRLTTDQKIAGSNPAEIDFFFGLIYTIISTKWYAPPGGLEPPTFRLTAERASRLRHGGRLTVAVSM